MARTYIKQLTDDEQARFNEWADKWIEIGLRTGPADREKFEAAVRKCYEFAGIPWPGVVVWVPSPLTLAFAAPAAAVAIEAIVALSKQGERAPKAARASKGVSPSRVAASVRGAVRDAVGDAVGGAVRDAVGGAVGGAVSLDPGIYRFNGVQEYDHFQEEARQVVD